MNHVYISSVVLLFCFFFFFNDTATTEIYTLSLHDALPIWLCGGETRRDCQTALGIEFEDHCGIIPPEAGVSSQGRDFLMDALSAGARLAWEIGRAACRGRV